MRDRVRVQNGVRNGVRDAAARAHCLVACGMAWTMLSECVPACLRRRAAPASSPGPHAALGSSPSPCDKH
ncbi:hypothetical protein HMPREF1868_00590 [Olsenella sp. DNF00959]|nr:hypothetical protein HMPREF1868_00590 [Olsenella sp. DNF00959]